jgi:hypothetical protein
MGTSLVVEQAQIKIRLNAVQMRHNRLVECTVLTNEAFGPIGPNDVATYEGLVINQHLEFRQFDHPQAKRTFIGKVIVEVKEDAGPNAKIAPYFFKVVAEGLFEVPADPPEGTDVGQLVAIHGTAGLVGVVRETVAMITSRGVHGQFLIPSMIFSPDSESSKAQSEEKSDTERPR